jgi:acetyl-CoA synthetase
VGYPHEIKGNALYAYVILLAEIIPSAELKEEIRAELGKIIGPVAKPYKIQFVTSLPKTRSGKIKRRILRKVASGDTDDLDDTSTLLNPEAEEGNKK